SSLTSRSATSSDVSPGFGVPFGSTQKLSPRPTSTTSTGGWSSTAGEVSPARRNRTPPAENARTVRDFGMDIVCHTARAGIFIVLRPGDPCLQAGGGLAVSFLVPPLAGLVP